jgi:hypothetical protein
VQGTSDGMLAELFAHSYRSVWRLSGSCAQPVVGTLWVGLQSDAALQATPGAAVGLKPNPHS